MQACSLICSLNLRWPHTAHPKTLTWKGPRYEISLQNLWHLKNVYLLAVHHMSSYHPILLLGIHNFKFWRHEQLSLVTCAIFHVLHPSPSHQIHLIFYTSSLPLCLCQTALWAVASPVTWENRRQYIPSEHSFALRGFSPLSPPALSLFLSIPVLYCTVQLEPWATLHPRHSSPCLFLSLSGNHGKDACFCLCWNAAGRVISHSWHKLSFRTLLLVTVAQLTAKCW